MTENNTNNTNNNNTENNNINWGDILRRMAMAGLGAVTLTVEKSRELASMLVKKGEKTAEENNISYEQVRDQVATSLRDLADKVHTEMEKADFDDLLERLDNLSDEQRAVARERIDNPLPREEAACDETACGERTDCETCDQAKTCEKPETCGQDKPEA